MFPQQTGCSCACNAGPKLIFSCSGAADVGALVGTSSLEEATRVLGICPTTMWRKRKQCSLE